MIDVLELLGDRKIEAHSTILLTYAFDMLLFDGFLRRQLQKAGASNQIIFCDAGCYEKELTKTAATRFLGKSYSVTPVHQASAFHPKLYLLLGTQSGRMIIGSGNTTLGGLARNGELFGCFDFDSKTNTGPHPGFAAVVELIRELSKDSPPPVQKQLERAMARSPWLESAPQSDGRRIFFGGPGRPALLEQVLAATGIAEWDDIFVTSASFDRKLKAMHRLTELSKRGAVTCLVQPERALIDGDAVKAIGDRVDWRPLTLPKMNATTHAKERFSHAKLYVFQAGEQEYVAYGTANASSPALLDVKNPNTEVLVLLPPIQRGETVKKLELAESLQSPSAFEALSSRKWSEMDNMQGSSHPVRLSGVGIDRHGSLAAVLPKKESAAKTLYLAIAEAIGTSTPAHNLKLSLQANGSWTCSVPGKIDALRVAWLIDENSKAISNCVVMTWQDVTYMGTKSGAGQSFDDAIIAMQHGDLPSTVFYTLLNRAADLSGSTKHTSKIDPEDVAHQQQIVPRSQDSFYSEQEGSGIKLGTHGNTDRSDLEMLGALVQPLPSLPQEDEETSHTNEEEERVNLDAGRDEHGEDDDQNNEAREDREEGRLVATLETVEKHARRLSGRLTRAAGRAEEMLGQTDLKLEAGPIARQIWMMHIAAYLAGREIEVTDGKAICLAPLSFARYTIRMGHAMSGGKQDGLLACLPNTAWEGYDGENLRRGLAFCWTCVKWAAAYLVNHWGRVANPSDHPQHLAESIPELVAANYQAFARQRCEQPDEEHLSRRLPASTLLSEELRKETYTRIDTLEMAIADCSAVKTDEYPGQLPAVKSGDLVFSAGGGITIAIESGLGYIKVLSLSCTPRAATMKRPANAQGPAWLKTFRKYIMRPAQDASYPKPNWWPTEDYLKYLSKQQPKRR